MTACLVLTAAAGAAGETQGATLGVAGAGSPVVVTQQGQLVGISRDGADRFLGVPYAKPPIKNLRFAPPQQPAPWRGLRDATDQAAACLQFQPTGVREGQAVSEDCLYLDVYRPTGARPADHLPVLVWFHGGGWTQGTGVIYGGQTMARLTHAIVVSINYRLGALGWLALPQLDRTQPLKSGNYGMLDQIQALRWIHANIAGFGGDPRNVTIDGQSAGAGAVCTMLASPLAKGLFAKGIIESLGCNIGANSHEDAVRTSQQYAAAAGCATPATVVACLRSAWAPNLISAEQKVVVRAPTYGTPVLPRLPSAAIAAGSWNRVPVMVGNTRWEGKLFIIDRPDLTAAQYVAQIRADYGADADQVLHRYPLSAYSKPFYALAAVVTDSFIACPANDTANLLAPRTQVYRYEFNDPTSPTLYGFQPPGIDMSDAHSAELAYLFDFTLGARPLTAYEEALSRQMMRYWASFARDGNPQVAAQPAWPRYTVATHRSLVLRPSGSQVSPTIGAEHQCAFWSSMSS